MSAIYHLPQAVQPIDEWVELLHAALSGKLQEKSIAVILDSYRTRLEQIHGFLGGTIEVPIPAIPGIDRNTVIEVVTHARPKLCDAANATLRQLLLDLAVAEVALYRQRSVTVEGLKF